MPKDIQRKNRSEIGEVFSADQCGNCSRFYFFTQHKINIPFHDRVVIDWCEYPLLIQQSCKRTKVNVKTIHRIINFKVQICYKFSVNGSQQTKTLFTLDNIECIGKSSAISRLKFGRTGPQRSKQTINMSHGGKKTDWFCLLMHRQRGTIPV